MNKRNHYSLQSLFLKNKNYLYFDYLLKNINFLKFLFEEIFKPHITHAHQLYSTYNLCQLNIVIM